MIVGSSNRPSLASAATSGVDRDPGLTTHVVTPASASVATSELGPQGLDDRVGHAETPSAPSIARSLTSVSASSRSGSEPATMPEPA